MASLLRQTLANKLSNATEAFKSPLTACWNDHAGKLPWCMRFKPVSKRRKPDQPMLQVSIKNLQACNLLENAPRADVVRWAEEVASKIEHDDLLTDLSIDATGFSIHLDQRIVTDLLLKEVLHCGDHYGYASDFHKHSVDKGGHVTETSNPQNVVVEFSSPNIAKSFHAGHLRSTIIGNVISNLHRRLGHHVTRINYLGDWGTQFGLLGVGLQKYGDEKALQNEAMQHLFEVYVRINAEAESDPEIQSQGREFFKKMELGDENCLSLWRLCRDRSIEDYSAMYKRLGVDFDEYHGESMYYGQSLDLVKDAAARGILEVDPVTGVGYIELGPSGGAGGARATLTRADGATLYLTRDIAAAIDRYKKYKFDKLLYVVENGQHLHFTQLVHCLRRLGQRWADSREPADLHVKFGRVEGMSTRRGEVVFLRDILDEAKARMLDNMRIKETTKLSSESALVEAADRLATSAIIVQDLKQKRLVNYRFSWDRMLDWRGDTGLSLQYTHARLSNIARNSDLALDEGCDLEPLREDVALNLVQHLARFDEVLQSSVVELEPCLLVQYLFMTSRLANVAADELYVQGQDAARAKARRLLFHCTQSVLATGLRTLGIEPLCEM